MRRRVSREWVSVQKGLADRIARECADIAFTCATPPELYHFTDCGGLIGIFNEKTLWASLATSLNDRSETKYGLDLAQELVADSADLAVHSLPMDSLEDALKRQSWRIFVVSFCAHHDTALQWLHYGRSGSGVVVGFKSALLEKGPFRLYPVLYLAQNQRDWVRGIISKIDTGLTEALASITVHDERESLRRIALDLAAAQIWAMVPRVKNPAFHSEDEWRLVASVPRGEGVPLADDPAGETFFRTTGGRVVPYKKIRYDVLPAASVTLGADSSMQQDLLALRVLMEDTIGAPLEPIISKVLVRT
jgi:hypothetical protein